MNSYTYCICLSYIIYTFVITCFDFEMDLNISHSICRVAEYIPPRPLFPKRTNGAQRVSIANNYVIPYSQLIRSLYLRSVFNK